MGRKLALLYGIVSYILFFATFLYAVGFVGNLWVPKSIDSGSPGPIGIALVVDLVLLGIFAVQHSVMARPGFKTWWTKFVPPPVERTTYVLLSSLALILLFWQWQPLPGSIWEVQNAVGRNVLWALFWLGWVIVLVSTFLISHLDLFGLRQVYLYMKNQPYTSSGFRTPFLYRFVRHPIMLGFLVAFWATPEMTVSHGFFAAATTAYILIALQFEERDLLSYYGTTYQDYRKQVSMIIPIPRRK